MDTNNFIPNREIGDEEGLLDRLWTGIPDLPSDNLPVEQGYADLQDRIARKLRRRRIQYVTGLSGIAAVIAIAFMVWRMALPDSSTGIYAQLENLGVRVTNDEVVLKVDGGVIMSLDSAARIEQRSAAAVALKTSSGKAVDLAGTQMLKVEVPAGRRFELTLSDGTRVWLNAGSSLEYPATFAGDAVRRVRLEGEAFFEVKRDTAFPFYVEIGDRERIRVLGTSFNVNAYPDAAVHTTTLLTGKISYKAGVKQPVVILSPDEQVKLDCVAGVTDVRKVDASLYTGWKDGWICFENEQLAGLAQRLSRAYGINIRVEDRCKEYSFSGKIRFDRGIDYITKLVTETTDVVCIVEKGEILLK